MIYVLCGAYKALLFALYLKQLGKDITIVTYNKNTIKYCSEEKIKYIPFEFFQIGFFSFHKIPAFKKMLDSLIKKIDIKKNDHFFLLGNINGFDFFYLAKELSRKGKGHYKNPDKELEKFKPSKMKPFFFRGGIVRFLMKCFLGLDLIYYSGTNNSPAFGIDNSFLKKYNIVEYEPDIPSEEMILEAVKNNKTNYKEYEILIIDDALLTNTIKIDSLKKTYENLFALPVKFVFKKHPKFMLINKTQRSSIYSLFNNCEEAPSYIPVELLCNNIKKAVISVASMSLIPASQLNHLKAVSLLELVEWHDPSWKKESKDRLNEKSKNKILFPKSYEELRKILL